MEPLNNFIPGEDYHQDYLDKNPGGYCHINLALADEPLEEPESHFQKPEVVRLKQKEEAHIIAKELLAKVGLLDKMDSYPAHMSGRQQQRAGIARALAVNPKCILFDEPTSSLDPELVYEVQEVIRQLAKEDNSRMMIIVTHEMTFAKDVADRVVYLENGKICMDLPSDEFFSMENTSGRISRFINKA